MDEGYHEYDGDAFAFSVTEGQRGPVLRFLRGTEVITEIHLSYGGAERLAKELLGSIPCP